MVQDNEDFSCRSSVIAAAHYQLLGLYALGPGCAKEYAYARSVGTAHARISLVDHRLSDWFGLGGFLWLVCGYYLRTTFQLL